MLQVTEVKDARVFYCPSLIEDAYETLLKDIVWSQGQVFVAGQWRNEARLTCLLADALGKEYIYAGKKMWAAPFPESVIAIREKVHKAVHDVYPDINFDTCLCDYYEDGNKSIG